MRKRNGARRGWLGWFVATAACVVGGEVARAQQASLVVEIGKSVERNVGYARGWACDDPALISAGLTTRGDHNVWVVTGQKTGSTQCRVGTDPYGTSYLFNVRVVARHGQ